MWEGELKERWAGGTVTDLSPHTVPAFVTSYITEPAVISSELKPQQGFVGVVHLQMLFGWQHLGHFSSYWQQKWSWVAAPSSVVFIFFLEYAALGF